jgi:hypothetical protein
VEFHDKRRIMKNEKQLIVPEEFDFSELTTTVNTPSDITEDKAYILLDMICENMAYDYAMDNSFNGMVGIHAKVAQKNGVRNIKALREWLATCGIIQYDWTYVVGEHPMHYGFSKNYGNGFKLVELSDKRLERRYLKNKKRTNRVSRVHPKLFKWMDHLTLDHEGAQQDILEQFKNDKNRAMAMPSEAERYVQSAKAKARYLNALGSIQRDLFDEHLFVVDSHGKRLHTNVTIMPNIVRKHLSYKGGKLISLDLKASQLQMSLVLFQPKFWEWERMNEFSLLSFRDLFPRLSSSRWSCFSSNMLAKTSELSMNSDFQNYTKLILTDDIYTYLLNNSSAKGDPNFPKNRDEMKADVSKNLYSKNSYLNQYLAKSKKAFYELFPSLKQMIYAINEAVGEKAASMLLQRIESSFILDRLVFRISEERPDIPLWTVHDCIYTTEEHREYIERVLCEEGKSCLGNTPRYSVEN